MSEDLSARVSLRELTKDTFLPIIKLMVAEGQERFVANNAVSLAQALFNEDAWYRGIYLDDEPAGFVMLSDETLLSNPPPKPGIFVWRFMIDARFQRRGVGRAALEQVIAHVREKGVFTRLGLSYVPGEGSPEGFYRGLGFRPNGKIMDGEVVLEIPLLSGQETPPGS